MTVADDPVDYDGCHSNQPHCHGPTRGAETPNRFCHQHAGRGTPHPGIGRCKLHGGSTSSHSKNAEVAIVRNAAQIYGIPRHIDPADGLMEEYWRTAGLVSAYEAHVMMLKREEIVSGAVITEEAEGVGELTADGHGVDPEMRQLAWKRRVVRQAAISVWVKLLNDERTRFMQLGAKIVELGLEARRTAIMGTQVSILAGIVMHPELALSDDQRRTMARLLREIDGSVAA